MARRVYGTMKAFAAVRNTSDWREPRNNNKDANKDGQPRIKWVSKVNWAILEELDYTQDADDLDIDDVDDALRHTL